MKKITLVFLAVVTAVIFTACNGGEEKKADDIAADNTKTDTVSKNAFLEKNCAGVWNLVVGEAEAMEMIERYGKIFRKKGETGEVRNLEDSVWIDGLVIRSLATFFESSKGAGFDGARFIHGAPTGNNKTVLFLVPTKSKDSGHKEIWGNVFQLVAGDPIRYMDYNRDSVYAKVRTDRFESVYRKPGGTNIDSLSKKVWIDKCVFIELRKIIENTEDQVEGVRIWFGAYKDKTTRVIRGQEYGKQSTVILVPTTRDNFGNNNDRWDIIRKKYVYINDAGFNHGELCPQQCE